MARDDDAEGNVSHRGIASQTPILRWYSGQSATFLLKPNYILLEIIIEFGLLFTHVHP